MRASLDTLTLREREVMVLVVTGLQNKQIAHEIGVIEATVKVHRGQVMRRMRPSAPTLLPSPLQARFPLSVQPESCGSLTPAYLFEITTYPDLGPWLAQIIETIRF
jgi:hypothetical protein